MIICRSSIYDIRMRNEEIEVQKPIPEETIKKKTHHIINNINKNYNT